MRIVVTGATGFIGSAFVRRAAAAGHQVACLVRPGRSLVQDHGSDMGAIVLEGTLAQPPWTEIDSFAPDTLVHLAWIATPGVYLDSPENEDYLRWSLEFVRRARESGVRHVVGVGTCVEYDIDGSVLSESSSPIAPQSPYARAKHALHERLRLEAEELDYRCCWGRVFYPYGVGEPAEKLCSSLIGKLSRGETLTLKTPHSTKDYIHISDLVEAMLVTLERQIEGPINWGTGVGVSIEAVAGIIGKLLGREELVVAATDAPPDPLAYVVADASRLKGLGWRPQMTMEEGLRQLCESILSRSIDPVHRAD